MNNNITFVYELWTISEEELCEEPIIWLLDFLIKLTKNNIIYKILRNKLNEPPYLIEMKGDYQVIKELLIKENYIEKDEELEIN